jgi:hypothetical protein
MGKAMAMGMGDGDGKGDEGVAGDGDAKGRAKRMGPTMANAEAKDEETKGMAPIQKTARAGARWRRETTYE